VQTAQRGFPRRGEQEGDRRKAVRQQTPSGGCTGTGSVGAMEPGSPETPASPLALPEVFCVTLGKPFNVRSVLVSLQTERAED